MSKKDGGPAFPDLQRLQLCKNVGLSDEQREKVYLDSSGMFLRDYFAAAALQGELASQSSECGVWNRETAGKLASFCYSIADAMLAERDK